MVVLVISRRRGPKTPNSLVLRSTNGEFCVVDLILPHCGY